MVKILIAVLFIWMSAINHGVEEHAIYISVIEITIPDDSSEGTILIKTFSDDLQNAMHHKDSNFGISSDPCINSDLISAYAKEHLYLDIQDVSIEFELTDCQLMNDSHWLSFEFMVDKAIDKMTIETDWLTELFPTQANIVKIKSGTESVFERFTKEKTKAVVELK